jgi:excinuclease ABC subunit C
LQSYTKLTELPEEILIPLELEESEAIAEILASDKPRKVRVAMPQRGEKRNLIDIAQVNAEATFKKEKDLSAIREKTLLEMQETLHLNQYPARIECFDNSNLSGTEPVSAMVVFIEGDKDKKYYRKYKIKTVSSPDDYATMYEVLLRRYQRAKDENDLPNLVIIDGGKGHLNVALRVFKELNVVTVDVISVAKEQGRHDRGITAEQVFLPDIRDPILLKPNSPVLFMLQQIRDEAHRFAISFHRQRRGKQLLRSELEAIPGIGPIRQRRLLRHFGSLKNIGKASREELEQLKGLSKTNIDAIIAFFKEG